MEEKETVTQRERLEQQLRFIVEVDKVKNIFRQTYLQTDSERRMMRSIRGIWLCRQCF